LGVGGREVRWGKSQKKMKKDRKRARIQIVTKTIVLDKVLLPDLSQN
jgi:hypothetical protein